MIIWSYQRNKMNCNTILSYPVLFYPIVFYLSVVMSFSLHPHSLRYLLPSPTFPFLPPPFLSYSYPTQRPSTPPHPPHPYPASMELGWQILKSTSTDKVKYVLSLVHETHRQALLTHTGEHFSNLE